MSTTRLLFAVFISTSMITYVRAGDKPSLKPSPEYLIGTDKSNSMEVDASGGSSDVPSDPPQCGPWTLQSGSDVWQWNITGVGTGNGSTNKSIQITPNGTVGDITVSASRNDSYVDGATNTELGTPSPDSDKLTIHVVDIADPSTHGNTVNVINCYYVNHPKKPVPYDIENHTFNIEGSVGSLASTVKWSANDPAKISFIPQDATGTSVTVKSEQSGKDNIQAKTDEEDIDNQDLQMYSVKVNKKTTFLSEAVFYDILISWGWDQDGTTDLRKVDGDGNESLISNDDGIGTNEYFENRKDVAFGAGEINSPQQVCMVLTGSAINDHYSYHLNSVNYDMWLPGGPVSSSSSSAQNVLYTIDQTYSVGSTTPNDGYSIVFHTLSYMQGGVSWSNERYY